MVEGIEFTGRLQVGGVSHDLRQMVIDNMGNAIPAVTNKYYVYTGLTLATFYASETPKTVDAKYKYFQS